MLQLWKPKQCTASPIGIQPLISPTRDRGFGREIDLSRHFYSGVYTVGIKAVNAIASAGEADKRDRIFTK